MEDALRMELKKNRPEHDYADQIRGRLLDQLEDLHSLAQRHNIILHNFKIRYPHLEFPALHKELFSQDFFNNNNQQQHASQYTE